MMARLIHTYQNVIESLMSGTQPDRGCVKANALAAAYALDDAIVNNRPADTEKRLYDASVWLLATL